MRLRNSLSSASETWTLNGRIAAVSADCVVSSCKATAVVMGSSSLVVLGCAVSAFAELKMPSRVEAMGMAAVPQKAPAVAIDVFGCVGGIHWSVSADWWLVTESSNDILSS
jgi:hypothetical protein